MPDDGTESPRSAPSDMIRRKQLFFDEGNNEEYESDDFADEFSSWVTMNKKLQARTAPSSARTRLREPLANLGSKTARGSISSSPGMTRNSSPASARPRTRKTEWDSRTILTTSLLGNYNSLSDKFCPITKTKKYVENVEKNLRSSERGREESSPKRAWNKGKKLEGDVTALKKQLKQLRQDHEDHRITLARKQMTIDELKQEKELNIASIEKLKNNLTKVKDKLKKSRAQLEKEELGRSEKDKTIERLQEELKRIKGQDSLPDVNSSNSSSKIAEELEFERRMNMKMAAEIHALKTQNSKLTSQVNQASQPPISTENLTGQLSKMRKKLALTEEANKALQDQVAEYSRQRERIEKMQQSLVKKEDLLQKLTLNKSQQDAEIKELRQHLELATKDLHQAQIERRNSIVTIDEKSKELISEQLKKSEAEKRLLKLERANEELKQQLASINEENAVKNKDRDEDKRLLKRFMNRVTDLEKERNDLEETTSQLRTKLTSQKDNLQKDYDSLKLQFNEQQQQLQRLEQRNKKLEEIHSGSPLLNEDSNYQQTIQKLKEEIQALSLENNNLKQIERRKLADVTSKLQESEKRLAVLSESNSLLIQKLNRNEHLKHLPFETDSPNSRRFSVSSFPAEIHEPDTVNDNSI